MSAPKANLLEDDEKTETEAVKTEPKKEESLLGDFNEVETKPVSQPSDSILDFSEPTVPQKQVPAADDFNTMQNMFSTVNVSSQPVNNSVDMFASEPKKEEPSTISAFDFSMSSSNANANNFATGVNFEASEISSKQFATSSPGNKPLEVDFFNLPPKQESGIAAFAKKPAVEQKPSSQVENFFAEPAAGSNKSI